MIVSAFATEQRGRNDRVTYLCPICSISYGYIKEDLPLDQIVKCSACNVSSEVAEFIPIIDRVCLDIQCAIFSPVIYKSKKGWYGYVGRPSKARILQLEKMEVFHYKAMENREEIEE